MDIKEMEELGIADIYLELKEYINDFINRNYRLLQDDMRSIAEDNPTNNVKRRNEAYKILNEALKEILEGVANGHGKIISEANKGNFIPYTVKNQQAELFAAKQRLLATLWEKQHGRKEDIEQQGRKIQTSKETDRDR